MEHEKRSIVEECKRGDYLFPDSFRTASVDEIVEQSNGIGPDKFPAWVRTLIAVLFAIFRRCSVIHDWEFGPAENDGTRERWHEANSRWLENARRDIRRTYRWWRPFMRYKALGFADLFFVFLESPKGWNAWVEAYARNQQTVRPTDSWPREGQIEEIRKVVA